MAKALFVNDTGGESNPGCRAVSATIRRMLTSHGYELVTVPLGYWGPEFKDLDTVKRKAFSFDEHTFPHWTELVPDIDVEAWNALRLRLFEQDIYLEECFADVSLVVINGEGSIHHNFPRGLALLAIAKCALEHGLPVRIVNSTIQAMSASLLARVVPELDLLHVREPRSFAAMEPLAGARTRLSSDLAFAGEFHPVESGSTEGKSCLLTSGVGAHPAFLALQIDAIRAAGWSPVYLLIGDSSEREVAGRVCGERGVEILTAGALDWKEMPRFLSRFPLAVSGRHHINIFLMHAGVPFVPLPSNTWKIEETLRFVEYPMAPAATPTALAESLLDAGSRLSELGHAARASAERGVRLVQGVL